jgi:hypothetical protein
MTHKQRRFALEYLVDANATKAAIRAGYSKRTAKQQGSRLLTNADVAALVASGHRTVEARAEITVDRVLREAALVLLFDPVELVDPVTGKPRLLDDIPEDARRAIASCHLDNHGRLMKVLTCPPSLGGC